MMKQASYELGFEADDIPLMIEAIPVSSECIVLIVTKVDDPEELDTRFSKFSPFGDEYDDDEIPFDDYDSLETIDSYGYDDMNIPSADDELDYSDDAVDNDIFNLLIKSINILMNQIIHLILLLTRFQKVIQALIIYITGIIIHLIITSVLYEFFPSGILIHLQVPKLYNRYLPAEALFTSLQRICVIILHWKRADAHPLILTRRVICFRNTEPKRI